VNVLRIRDGLWRWTGLHPEWQPGFEWQQEVACVYAELTDAIVLVDPLVPPEDPERFLRHLDADVERLAAPVAILLTTPAHRRSADALAERYDARVGVVPGGVRTHDLTWYDEQAYWLPEHGAVAFGDAVHGRDGGVALASSWLGDDEPRVREALRPLLDLPVETLLPAHGQPVPRDGREALARALA
jgi:glyoxylase-like metal-dependent hydrolase (beta-lactamase superfamily II)